MGGPSTIQAAPESSRRPRRRWSPCMGSLDVMVKSMMDLRQLETFAPRKSPTGSLHGRDRQSTSSLQEATVRVEPTSEPVQKKKTKFAHLWFRSSANCQPMSPVMCLQLDDGATRYRPWPLADAWLPSSPSSHSFAGTEETLLCCEDNEDDTSLRDR